MTDGAEAEGVAHDAAADPAEVRRRQADAARFALVVLCGVRALVGGIGLLRAVATDSIDQWWGFQGWITAIVLTVLYVVAAVGYRGEGLWPRVASIAADVLSILVVVDVFSRPELPEAALLAVLQVIVLPTVSLVLALMVRRPSVADAR